jgi:hypothetical protein
MAEIWIPKEPTYHEVKEWYYPWEIKYNSDQIKYFLLPYYRDMVEGTWPAPPEKIVRGCQHQFNTKAYFQTACDIIGELSARIRLIGPRGNILIDRYTDMNDMLPNDAWREVARLWHSGEGDIRREVKRMIIYVRGWRRVTVPYPVFLKTKVKYKEKIECL